MADGSATRRLHTAECVAYWAAAAPVLGHLPAAIGYRLACRRGDWLHHRLAAKRTELERNVRDVLGNEVSEATVDQLTRQWFRFASCEAVDVTRLRHRARPLRRLVHIRGREHLEAALAEGNGAILCSAHIGSYESGFCVLHASGFPVTTLGRWQHKYTRSLSAAERRFWDLVYARPVRRLRQRPHIEPWPGRIGVAAQAAAVLQANEVLTISIDAPPLDRDKGRVVAVPFLGREARLLPGIVTLARLTGAPVLPSFLVRSADYRHQILEISPPVPMDGDIAAAFGRCVAEIAAAIVRSPAQWRYWASTADLATIGLISPTEQRSAEVASVASVTPQAGERVLALPAAALDHGAE